MDEDASDFSLVWLTAHGKNTNGFFLSFCEKRKWKHREGPTSISIPIKKKKKRDINETKIPKFYISHDV